VNDLLFEEKFGACRRLKADEVETILIGAKGDPSQIEDLYGKLEHMSRNESHPGYQHYYKDRLSRLQGKACTIYVGGITPVEVTENRDKIVDALNSCQTAMEFGILPGGGTAFIHALTVLEDSNVMKLDVGANIFYQSVIVRQIFLKFRAQLNAFLRTRK